MPMVVRRKGWMYLGMMQNTWTTASRRLSVRGQRGAAALLPPGTLCSQGPLDLWPVLLASKPLAQHPWASP